MAISAKLVKELREKTGAGMMDCKKALEACDGDIEASFDWLREKGIAKSAKKLTELLLKVYQHSQSTVTLQLWLKLTLKLTS